MIRALTRCIARWHQRQHIKDLNFQIRVHEAHLRDLPTEIRRLHQIKRCHQGRLATLSEAKSPVNFHLGRTAK